MKHYLDLVPISVKIHRKQSRMSIFCIVLAVFLVTTIFGMADMFVRSQILQTQQEYGNWHIAIKNISNEEASIIASRPDVKVFSPYGVLNYRGDLALLMTKTVTLYCYHIGQSYLKPMYAVVLIWFYVVMHTEGSFDCLLLGGLLPPIKGCFLNMIPVFIQTERQIWLLAVALEIVLFHSDLIIVQRLY